MWSDQIDAIPLELLQRYFNNESPIGPLNARLVAHSEILALLTERDLNSIQIVNRHPSIVVGRRGSGKTSYLRRLGLDSHNSSLFLDIKSEKTFNLILATIEHSVPRSVTVESVSEIWEGIFWNCLFWALNSEGRPRIGRVPLKAHLQKIRIGDCKNLQSVFEVFSDSFRKISKSTGAFAVEKISSHLRGHNFERMRELVSEDLMTTGDVALLVLDSLDDYPINISEFKKAMAGLLKSVGEFNAVTRGFDVRLCIPSEMYWEFVEKISTNSMKDFSNQLVVRWRVGELMITACRRLMIYLKI